MEIAEDFDGGRLLELATLDGIFGKSEGEDHVVALLGGGEVGDRGGNRRFAFDRFTGNAAAGEKGQTSENGKEKMEIWMRDCGRWRPAEAQRASFRISIFDFL